MKGLSYNGTGQDAAYLPLYRKPDTEMDTNASCNHGAVAPDKGDPRGPRGPAVAVQYVTTAEEEKAGRCRWGPFSPDCCQTFRRPAWFLVFLCWAGFVQGMVVNGFVNVVISTLERRFQITSTESGTIASCYDIAAVLLLVPVTYFGGRGRKPLYLALGMLFLGLGSFVFTLPHFAVPPYDVSHAEYGQSVCLRGGANATGCQTVTEGLSSYRYVFFLGQLMHGAGAAPLYTLGVTYLDDNLPVRATSLYQGIFYAFAIFGPGVGYLLGGAFLSFYTDFNRVDMFTVSVTTDNPRWVGAWWVGFLIGGLMGVVIAFPLLGFPKSLPGSEEYRQEKEKEVYKGKGVGLESGDLGFNHIVASVRLQLTNPTFMILNLAAACESGVVSGFSTFAPKYIESQFGLTSGFAAQLVGVVAIPAGGGATFLGGWLVKRLDWDIPRILRFSFVVTVVTTILGLIFLIHCPNLPFAGVSAPYMQPASAAGTILDKVALEASCNAGCGCSLLDYNPVCGRDNVMYYSPCYAGCTSASPNATQMYSNCSCLQHQVTSQGAEVVEGKCTSDCTFLPLFLPIFALLMIGIFITSMPALTATLRCVAQEQRSFALGIQWIIARCLGSIPGPILFGKAIDLTCVVWQSSCKGQGACLFYDNERMSHNLLAVGLAYNAISCLAFLLALLLHRTARMPSSLDVTLRVRTPSCRTSLSELSQPSTPRVEHAAPANGAPPVPLPAPPFPTPRFVASRDVVPARDVDAGKGSGGGGGGGALGSGSASKTGSESYLTVSESESYLTVSGSRSSEKQLRTS